MAEVENRAAEEDEEGVEEEEEAIDEQEPAAEDLDGEEEDVQEAEEDPFERLDDDEEENEEQQRQYKEYLELIKDIEEQNGRILDLKSRANCLREKPCRSRKDQRELERLRICQEQENIKLLTMMNRAMQLQNYGSRRLYGDVELATTAFEEDVFLAGPLCRTLCPGGASAFDDDAC